LLSITDLSSLINQSGDIHNAGLLHIMQNPNQYFHLANTTLESDAVFTKIAGFIQSEYGFDSASLVVNEVIDSFKNQLDNGALSSANANDQVINSYWNSNKLLLINSNLISSNELKYLDSVYNIQHQDFTGLQDSEVCNRVIIRLNSLIGQFNNDRANNLLSGVNGELAGPLLHIALSSAQYWKIHINDYQNHLQPMYVLPADAFGYLVGWTSIWWKEANSSNYSTSWEAQKRRIGAGVIAGLGASGAKYL
jgi:hypothetical protein